MTVTFLTGTDPEALRREAFERASDIAGDEPRSVLVATGNGGQEVDLADAWAATYDPLRIHVTDLDGIAGEAYKRHVGPGTRLDTQTRRQTIDRALRFVAAETGMPEAHAHEREFRELLSELAAAGYDDPDELGEHVDAHLDDQPATVLRRVAETAAELRGEFASESYTLPEAYRVVCEATDPEELVDADVLVVTGYLDPSPNQLDLLECFAERTPTEVVVTLPLATTTGKGDPAPSEEDAEPTHSDIRRGIDAYVGDTYADLVALADEHVYVQDVEEPSGLTTAVGRMFTRTPTTDDAVPSGLAWHTAATPIRESRAVARRVRRQIAAGASAEDVIVVAPELLTYRDRLSEAFDAVGVASSDAGRPPLGQTRVGRAALDLVDCCRSEITADDLANLASNPAVDLGDSVRSSELLSLVEHLPTDSLDRLREELSPEADAVVETVLDHVDAVRKAPREETIERLRDLFAYVGLGVGDDTAEEGASGELAARQAVDRTLAAVGRVGDPADDSSDEGRDSGTGDDLADPLRRVADALDGRRVASGRGQPGTVEIVGVQDAVGRSFDHLHVVGLTRSAFPPDDQRSRFFGRMFESLPSVTATDRRARARYQFAILVGSAETVDLSHPRVGTDGDERLPSPVLTELARVTGLDPDGDGTADGSGNDSPTPSIADAGDLQRALAGHDEATRETALTDAVTDAAVSTTTAEAVRRGADCLAGRTGDELGEYDGQLDATTVTDLHDPEPHSPTGLRSYARCGFRYYADRVLGFEEPPEYPLEPTALDRGSLVHDALERFFDSLLTAPDEGTDPSPEHSEAVDLAAYDRPDLERRLLEAVETEIDALDTPMGDAFGTRWLETLLAGLANPAENDHYGEKWPHTGVDEGLFVRYLDAELDADDRVLAVETPLDFEEGGDDVQGYRGGDDHAIEFEAPDGRAVAVHGRVDRVSVETDGSEESPEISGYVHDYKTSDPTTKQTFDGVEFQLPIYTVATQRELARRYGNELASVDGAFYTVEPPKTVRRKRSLLGTIYRHDGDVSDFEHFLDVDVPTRIADVADSISGGGFHTTTLDSETAGCDYCRFADVCGVRHHRRQERADAAADAGHYVPEAATPGSYYDTLGGEES